MDAINVAPVHTDPVTEVAPAVSVTRTTSIFADGDGDGKADPGDTLVTHVDITNPTGAPITNVSVTDTLNGTTFVPGSVTVTPVANDDAYSLTGNTPITFAANQGLLVNDTDADSSTPNSNVGLTVTSVNTTGTHGTVTYASDGSFTFTPETGYVGTTSFAYNVTDASGLHAVDTGIVTLTITGEVWYVDSGANAAGADGSYLHPFTTLAPLNGAGGAGDPDGANDTIFVYNRGTAYSGGIALEAGEKLFGDGHAFNVNGITIDGQSGNSTIGATTGTVVTLATDNVVQGVTLNANGANVVGLADGNGSVTTASGTFTASQINFGGTGQAVDIDQGGNLNVTVDSLTSGGSAAQGVQLAGTATSGTGLISGTFTVTAGSIFGSTMQGFLVGDGTAGHGGTITVSDGGTITKTSAGHIIDVEGHTANSVSFHGDLHAITGSNSGILVSNNSGGTINFDDSSGTGASTLSTSVNNAVDLTSNAGATINFGYTNGLHLTTTSGVGFNATGGGTVNVTGTGNTITSTTGAALNIANTTIGASNVTFHNISSNGAASGIVLNNTGSSGGLHVAGDAGATSNASGGTIQNSTGDGVSLNNTEDVRLGYMDIKNNLGDGIGGSTINGFLVNHANISGNGNDAATDESGINLANLTGSISTGARPTGIFNSAISNNNEFEVQITNSSGTLNNFQISSTAVSSNGVGINGNATSPHGNLVNFLGTGTSVMGLTVTNSQFTGNTTSDATHTITGTGIMANSGGTSMVANVSGSTFTNNNAGIDVSTDPVATSLNFNIANNMFTGQRSTAINQFDNGNGPFNRTVNGTITGNTIGNATANSGSQVGRGIDVSNEGAVNLNLKIDGNTIQHIQSFEGIGVNVGLSGQATGGGTTNVTITNNNIHDIQGSRGLIIQDNQDTTGGGPYPTINASISGNTFGPNIVGQAGNGQYMRIKELNGTVNVTQAAPTASAIAGELDDANGFNDPTKISLSGTPQFNHAPPTQPTTVTLSHAPVGSALSVASAGSQAEAGIAGHGPQAHIETEGLISDFAIGPWQSAHARDFTGRYFYREASTLSHADTGAVTAGGTAAEQPAMLPSAPLTQAALDTMVDAAIARWAAAGATPAEIAAMKAVSVTLSDIAGNQVGDATPGHILIDSDGGGYGWFVDATPGSDSEFHGGGSDLAANAGGAAAGRIDLLTTLMHELGHQIGLADNYTTAGSGDLMYGYVNPGERRLPSAADVHAATGTPIAHEAFALSPVSAGTITAGKAVEVSYRSTVNDYADGAAPTFTNTATVTYNGGSTATSNSETLSPGSAPVALDTLTLGDHVFLDANNNGTFDAGEGVSGVALTLFDDANHNGVFDAGTDTQVATTTTGAGGVYSFASLARGDYIVRVDASNFSAGGALAGDIVVPGTATDPDDNADNDNNGVAGPSGSVVSQAITLAFNSETTADATGHLDINNSLDFGFVANQPPTAVTETLSTDEGTPLMVAATTLLANDTDPDNDTLTVTGVSNAQHGTVSFDGTTVTFTPTGDFNGAASFDYTISDGHGHTSTVTDTVNVGAVNDAPVNHVPGAQTVDEGNSLTFSGANAISITDVDAGSGSLTVELSVGHGGLTLSTESGLTVTGDGTGAVHITGTLTAINTALDGLAYAPTGDYNGSDTLTITTDDNGNTGGGALTDIDTVAITVDPVNDAPVLSPPADPAVNYVEDTPSPTALLQGVTVTDADAPANFAGGGITLTISGTGGGLNPLAASGFTVDGTDLKDSDGDVVGTITGVGTTSITVTNFTAFATPTIVNQLVQAFGFYVPGDDPDTTDRTASLTFNDGGNTGSGGALSSNIVTQIVHVLAVNDAPSVDDATATVDEGTTVILTSTYFTQSYSDPDGNAFAGIKIVSLPAHGMLLFDADGAGGSDPVAAFVGETISKADLDAGKLTFVPEVNGNGQPYDSFDFQAMDDGGTANGGIDTSATATVSFDVNAINDTPILSSSPTVTTDEQTAVTLDTALSMHDADLDAFNGGAGDYAGATLSVANNSGTTTADDHFTIVDGADFIVSGNQLLDGDGKEFATFSGGDGSNLVITFTSADTPATTALVNEVAQALQYTNSSDTPPSSVDISVSLNDGDFVSGNQGTEPNGSFLDSIGNDVVTVNLTAVNDAPVNTVPSSVGMNEDVVDAQIVNISVSDVDADPDNDDIQVTFHVDHGTVRVDTNVAGGVGPGDVTDNGTGTIVITGTQNEINTTLASGVFYNPTHDYNGTDTLTMTTSDLGHEGTGGAKVDVDTVSLIIAAQDDPPVAVDDAKTTDEAHVASGNVLTNDTDVDGGPKTVATVNGSAANVGMQITLASGAHLTVNADGSYTYDPNGKFNYLTSTAGGETGAVDTQAFDTFTYTDNGGSMATVTVTINGLATNDDILKGDSGNNTITGTEHNDVFDLSQGGDDHVSGLGGVDAFLFGATFNAADQVDGGAGTNDQIGLQGDYTGANALVMGANTIANIEVIAALAGYDYDITTNDGNVAAGQVLNIYGSALGAGDNLTFNGSAEMDGSFIVYAGMGVDTLTGGAKNDGFYFGPGAFTSADHVDGGAGTNDQIGLEGNYTMTLGGNYTNIEAIILFKGPSSSPDHYNLSVNDDSVTAGHQLTISGTAVTTSITFDGSGEHDGSFRIFGGTTGDSLTGSDGNDVIYGLGGADTLTGGAGSDTFAYTAVSESTGPKYDHITDFDFSTDKIDLPGKIGNAVYDGDFHGGTLSQGSFNANLASDLSGILQANHAVLFEADSGDLAGKWFLVVDANHQAGYQANADYVIQVDFTGSPPPTTEHFII